MALVLAPEPPLADWLAALDAQIARAPGFFDQRPVLLDLGLLPPDQAGVAELIEAIAGRGIRIIGTEGAHKSWAVEKWGTGLGPPGPAPAGGARTGRPIELPEEPRPAERPAPAAEGSATTTLLIDHAVRSGQSIVHEAGDVTVLGTVAWGAEIVAGGSIHVYGTLRGRAIAGLNGTIPRASSAAGWRRSCWRSTASTAPPTTWTPPSPAGPCRPGWTGESMLIAALD